MSIVNFLLGEKEVISTFKPEVYSKAKTLLDKNKITYKVKSTYTGSGNRRTGNFISYGERVDCETQYQIFVSKSQFDLAMHILTDIYKQ